MRYFYDIQETILHTEDCRQTFMNEIFYLVEDWGSLVLLTFLVDILRFSLRLSSRKDAFCIANGTRQGGEAS